MSAFYTFCYHYLKHFELASQIHLNMNLTRPSKKRTDGYNKAPEHYTY